MLNSDLYRLSKEQLNKAAMLLSESFLEDPLYCELVPNKSLRYNVILSYFNRYLETIYDYGYIYADSEEMRGLIVIFDESADYSRIGYGLSMLKCTLKTALELIKIDPTFKTLFSFSKDSKFLSSTWVNKCCSTDYVHVDLLAVTPNNRGKGISSILLKPVFDYAEQKRIPVTLETHNPQNVEVYKHFGFKLVEDMKSNTSLHQYCMIRPNVSPKRLPIKNQQLIAERKAV